MTGDRLREYCEIIEHCMDDNDLWPIVFSLTFIEKCVLNFRHVWAGGRRAASVHYKTDGEMLQEFPILHGL